MVEIGKHISELLFDHDCVIVPSLGGFLASNQPSRILQPNQVIFPPYRRIAFNVYLKQNDGLLANHLVEAENIPYAEATRQIESFTTVCFDTLDNGKKVNIAEVGTLFYDKEKNIQFEAFRNFNHLKDSFGMDAVHFQTIQRDDKTEKKKLSAEKNLRASLPATNKNRSKINLSRGKRYLGIIAIVAAMIWFSLNLYLVAPKHYESTSLNPFDSQSTVLNKADSIRNIPSGDHNKEAVSKSGTSDVVPVPEETTASITDSLSEENSNKIKTTDLADVKKETPVESKTTPPPVPKEDVVVSSSVHKHYLVAGVFRIKENADAMLLHLQQLGFENAQIIPANNRNYVSYEGFTSHDQALTMVDSLHKKNYEGWIWKH